MRIFILLFGLLISVSAADKTFENSVLTFRYPDAAALNELDFDFMPEVSWKVTIDGKPAIIGLQRDDETSQQMLLDRAQANILRQLAGGTTSTFSTYGAIERCKGISVTGKSKNPHYYGEVTVYALTFTSGKKTVLLVAINATKDPRFAALLTAVRQSVKLKNN